VPRVRTRHAGTTGLSALLGEDRPTGERRSPFTRPGFILAALVIAGILVLLLKLLVFGGGGTDDPATGGGNPGHPVATDKSCPSMGKVDALPKSGADNDWWKVGALQAPVSLTDTALVGPLHGGNGHPGACFAPGPAGALFAAANFLADLTDPALVEPAIRQLTAPSAGRDALINVLETTPEKLNVGGSTGYSFVGYTFQSTAEAQVTVSLAIYTASGALGQVNMTVVREGNDWHVVPPPSGNFGDVVHQIADLTGFTQWRPTSG
jgi:hypothetical protein